MPDLMPFQCDDIAARIPASQKLFVYFVSHADPSQSAVHILNPAIGIRSFCGIYDARNYAWACGTPYAYGDDGTLSHGTGHRGQGIPKVVATIPRGRHICGRCARAL